MKEEAELRTKADTISMIGILLLVLAFLPLIVGGMFSSLIKASNTILNMGFLMFGLGISILIFGVILKAKEKTLPQSLTTLKSSPSIITEKEREVIKEIVLIPCTYCGGLMPQTSTFCPNCGAKRK